MSLESSLAAAVMNSGFQETIIVTPPGEASKEVLAVVERDTNPKVSEPGFPQKGVRFTIYNDPVKGLDVIKPGFLTATLPIRTGSTAVKLTVQKILGQNKGFWYLEAQE